jgi:photosystem II stability/assembly factor-like uncharacterized protein
MPDLDTQLTRGRVDLLETIDQPPLARIRDRARELRRRRTAGTAAGLLTVVVAATLVIRPWAGDPTPTAPPVAGSPPGGPVYGSAGITINGLTGNAVLRLPGTISDVEFVDADTGYLLSTCAEPAPCPGRLARTNDGGHTWQAKDLPAVLDIRDGVDLVAFADGRLATAGGSGNGGPGNAPASAGPGNGPPGGAAGYGSSDGGHSWQPALAGAGPSAVAHPGDLLRLRTGAGRCGGTVELWRSGLLRIAPVATQPAIRVCWVSPVPATDGAWWVGGTAGDRATLASTLDGGRTWRTVNLDVPARDVTSVEVASLGSHAYAVVLGRDRSIGALFHSADGGRSFTRTRSGPAGAPQGLAGAMVPLLDGRLLMVGTDRRWYLSADDGATFTRAEGNLPAVGRLARTPAGYVAYDLFGGGWAAFSTDGATWHKLQIN